MRAVCYCYMYKFPHRSGGGDCHGPGDSFCADCCRPAEGHLVDFGIGPYEHFGQRGVDVNKQWVSTCCDAEIVENTPEHHAVSSELGGGE